MKCACGGKKRAATEDLLEGEDMLTCDVCCRCVRLIFTVEGLKACLEIIRRREELEILKAGEDPFETGTISVIVHGEEEEEEEVPVPPPRRTSLRPPPRTSSLKQ